MPRLSYTYIFPANGTGERDEKFLMDISEGLSKHYGRLIRQSQNFVVKNAYIRVFNPDETGETTDDEVLACAGKLLYYEPTKNRMKAWQNAFSSWLANRKLLGVKSQFADFRVGFSQNYSTDVGIGNDGVKWNAWIKDEEDPLMFTHGDPQQSIFGVWNANQVDANQPHTPSEGFGTWIDPNPAADFDDLDFVTNQNVYFNENEASEVAQVAPFMVNFSAWFDNASSDPADFGSATNVQKVEGPLNAMCGVIGVFVDTVTVDDSESENQDIGLEIVLDVERWTPISKALKGGRSGKTRRRKKGGKR